jgi:hypothetical protein
MKKLICTITACILLSAIISAQTINMNKVETEVKALAAELRRSWDARDLDAYMACFGKPEGLIIIGGESLSLDTLKARTSREAWNKRKDESWENTNVQVIPLTNTSALLQITYSGRFTYIPTGVTWEFKSSAFTSSLVRNINGEWKVVAHQNSASGKQVKN